MTNFTPLSEPRYDDATMDPEADRDDGSRFAAMSPLERADFLADMVEGDLIPRQTAWELMGGSGPVPESFMRKPEPEVRELDALLAKGWHVMGSSYKVRGDWKMNALPVVRETRVVLHNKVLGQRVCGFGGDFDEAFSDALAQVK